MEFLGCVVCKKGLAGCFLVCIQRNSNGNLSTVRWDPVTQLGIILDQSRHFSVKAFSKKVFVLVLCSLWNRQVCLIDNVLLSHRTAAIKALNATGQHNINFDTLFKVFQNLYCELLFKFFEKGEVFFLQGCKSCALLWGTRFTAQLSLGGLKTESCSKRFWMPI